MPIQVTHITVWPLSIPMRKRFRHATAERRVSSPLVVAVDLAGGIRGYGETHARSYLTGERPEDVPLLLRHAFAPRLVDLRPSSFPEALEAIAALPEVDVEGRPVTAARAAVELALLDAYSRAFGRSLDTLAGWIGEPKLGTPGSIANVRYSGVVSAERPADVRRSIRLMRLYRLRDLKIKVGDAGDDDRLRAAIALLRSAIGAGRATLRVDANGGWTPEQATSRLEAWSDVPIACVEQPLPRQSDDHLARLASRTGASIMADESLITLGDAERLIQARSVGWFNIRIAKNGGLIPAIRLALLARHAGFRYQLGCLVGETSILSAAGRWFLQLVPDVVFAEGSYGRRLLRGDVCRRTLGFGLGGRAKPMTGEGLGVAVDESLLARYATQPEETIAL